MKPKILLKHELVEFIPEELKERTLYVSEKYGTAVHKCFCGCGHEVVTPLSPVGWQLTFVGKTVSLYPSIGSWRLPCKSHYFITRNRVEWAAEWSDEAIAEGQERAARAKEAYFASQKTPTLSFWQKCKKWLFG
jgi:hypothetical protein